MTWREYSFPKFIVSFCITVGPFFVLMWAGQEFLAHNWHKVAGEPDAYYVAYLVGIAVFGLYWMYFIRLEDTFVDRWASYGFVHLETLRYPKRGDSSDD